MKIIALLHTDSASESLCLKPTLSYPDSSIVKNGNPFFIPDFDTSFKGLPFLAVKISRLGKNVAQRFVSRYYSEVAPVMAIYAANLLNALKAQGLPWTIATGFDKSLAVGSFKSYPQLYENGPMILEDHICVKRELQIPKPEEIAIAVSEVSRYNSLKMGDLILIPLSADPVELKIDSLLTISSGDETLLKLPVK
ncbi:MAG: hypothetical protein K2H96_02140 [Muribaculaceae bacterium]|nr:hypothetical protein [Muribaculaceae bacterium]